VIAELDIHGVLIPALLVWGVIAVPIALLVGRALKGVGFYRFVWHPPLVDFCLFVIALGGVSALSKWIVP